ncbi:hypothetical protein GCM10010439_22950 [Actinocorallia aurantiaca]|uniref:Uncharacterized protein n=1 Tax=Actinocorallia aurantiaca TaxID=46204 RepID=A0ABP6GNG1_9ACTN
MLSETDMTRGMGCSRNNRAVSLDLISITRPRGATACGGTDVVFYGTDLLEYVNQEFEEPRPERPDDWAPQATVPFWRDYL